MLSRCCRRASFFCFMKHFTPKSNEKHPISYEIRRFPGRGRKTRTLDTRFWSWRVSPQSLWYQRFADFSLSRFRASLSLEFGSSKIYLQSLRSKKYMAMMLRNWCYGKMMLFWCYAEVFLHCIYSVIIWCYQKFSPPRAVMLWCCDALKGENCVSFSCVAVYHSVWLLQVSSAGYLRHFLSRSKQR